MESFYLTAFKLAGPVALNLGSALGVGDGGGGGVSPCYGNLTLVL